MNTDRHSGKTTDDTESDRGKNDFNAAEMRSALGQNFGSRIDADEFSWKDAVGGWRGITESVGPTLVFVVAFVAGLDVWKAGVMSFGMAAGLIIARLLSHQTVMQSVAGFAGVVIGVIWAVWSGHGENYFALGLWTNAAYLLVFGLSIVLRFPVIGLLVGFFREQGLAWRKDPRLRRDRKAYYFATFLWVGMFILRLAVKVPLFFAQEVAWLGTFQLILGVPLFALVLWLCWLVLRRSHGSFLASGLD